MNETECQTIASNLHAYSSVVLSAQERIYAIFALPNGTGSGQHTNSLSCSESLDSLVLNVLFR